jgi:hypothetical protein
LVTDESGGGLTAENSTVDKYLYTVDVECQLATYQVCVAAVNGAGIGDFSEPITFPLGSKFIFAHLSLFLSGKLMCII